MVRNGVSAETEGSGFQRVRLGDDRKGRSTEEPVAGTKLTIGQLFFESRDGLFDFRQVGLVELTVAVASGVISFA